MGKNIIKYDKKACIILCTTLLLLRVPKAKSTALFGKGKCRRAIGDKACGNITRTDVVKKEKKKKKVFIEILILWRGQRRYPISLL